MTTRNENVHRRTGTEAELRTSGQLEEGQAGFPNDSEKILHRRRSNAPAKAGQIIEWVQAADKVVATAQEMKEAFEDANVKTILVRNSFDLSGVGLVESVGDKIVDGFPFSVGLTRIRSAANAEFRFYNEIDLTNSGGSQAWTLEGLASLKVYLRRVKTSSGAILNFSEVSGSGFCKYEKNESVSFSGETGKISRELWNNTANESAGGSGLPVDGSSGFNILTSEPSFAEGKLFYLQSERTLVLMNDKSESRLSIGRERWLRVLNDTGAIIPNGAPVYTTGADETTELQTVALAKADNLITARVIGIATHDIAIGGEGEICTGGKVREIAGSSFAHGAELFLSATTAGEFTTIAPPSPNYVVKLANVTRAGASDFDIEVSPFTPTQVDPVSAAKLGVEAFPMALIDGQYGSFDGAFQFYTAFVSRFDTTITSLTSLITQSAGGGWVRMGVADSSKTLVGTTGQFVPNAVGLVTESTESPIVIAKNQIYYFVIGGTSNGCLFGGAAGYSANAPHIGYDNGNPNLGSGELESTPSGGSQSGNRFWMIGLG